VRKNDRNTKVIEAMYRQHGAALLLFASAISRDRGCAQDALHQVFLKLMENGKLSEAEDKKAYLFACVRNAVLNDSTMQNRNTGLDVQSMWFSPPDRDYAGERNLRRALAALPADQREAVVLHMWGELTFSEVGKLLGVSSNTAASRYRYGLTKLREFLLEKESACANTRQ
jgi:RNA polymerase sigma-70 factor (ECF subfamily)